MPIYDVTIFGKMMLPEVGGGPMPGGPPLGIWGGGNVPMPTPPIYIPQPPLGTWGGGNVPMPTPPIYMPQPGSGEGDGSNYPRWVYSPYYGWVIDPGIGGKPQPLPPTGGNGGSGEGEGGTAEPKSPSP